jgi:hypothetical protein
VVPPREPPAPKPPPSGGRTPSRLPGATAEGVHPEFTLEHHPEPSTPTVEKRQIPEATQAKDQPPKDVAPEEKTIREKEETPKGEMTVSPPAPSDRAEAIQRMQARAQAKQAELGERLTQVEAEKRQARSRILELNRELRKRSIDIRRLDEASVGRLPPETRALIAERAELIAESDRLIGETRQVTHQIQMWRRAGSSDIVAERYAQLRGRTPDPTARANASAASTDIVGKPNTLDNPLRPDHVVSVMDIVAMDNFVMLPDDVALQILNWEKNLTPLNQSANASKSDWSWSDWPNWAQHADPAIRNKMIQEEKVLRQQIYDWIQREFARYSVRPR